MYTTIPCRMPRGDVFKFLTFSFPYRLFEYILSGFKVPRCARNIIFPNNLAHILYLRNLQYLKKQSSYAPLLRLKRQMTCANRALCRGIDTQFNPFCRQAPWTHRPNDIERVQKYCRCSSKKQFCFIYRKKVLICPRSR